MADKTINKVTTDINTCFLMSVLLQQSNMFPQFVVEEHIFLLHMQRSVSPFILTLVVHVEPGGANYPWQLMRRGTLRGRLWVRFFQCWQMAASVQAPSGLLQIWLLWDVEKLEGNICSQTHLNTCQCLCASSSCLNLSDNTCAVSLLFTVLPSNPFSGVRHLFPASTCAPASTLCGRFLNHTLTWKQAKLVRCDWQTWWWT